jgi:predicted ATP-grasp superfamily ATP-dependent carboligase
MIDSRFGHMRKVGMVSLCCLLVLSIFAYAKETPKERPATVIVSPASGKASTVIVIQGSQFLPGEEVEVIMTVGDVYHCLGTAKADVIVADKKGTFEVSSGIPVKTPPGTYKIEATGNKGSVGVFNITVVK